MPITARFSKHFYDQLGDIVAQELVEWFNQVDTTYRTDLRELNEANFQRFDARLEQRMVLLESRLEQRMVALESRLEQRMASLESKVTQQMAALESKLEQRMSSLESRLEIRMAQLEATLERRLAAQTRWFFVAWASMLAAILLR